MDFKTPFFKYVATGNDFILVEDYDETFPLSKELIQHICERKSSIGADGLLLLQHSAIADVKMRIFNQDGSEATMCGNGLRCVIKHLQKSSTIETKGGLSEGEYSEEVIQVTLPKAQILKNNIPLPNDLSGDLADTGTPHLVIEGNLQENQQLALELRHSPLFEPGGVNVNVFQIRPEGIYIRTFEKGVEEETESCGTGGAAVSLLIYKRYKTNPIKIHFPKTSLTYHYDSKERLWLQGPASLSFEGIFHYKFKLL